MTIAYTGLPFPDRAGVSISIGYAGEFYIDFGIFGMMAGMGILGFFYGKASRYIQRHLLGACGLRGHGCTSYAGILFETSLPKTLGGVCTSFVVLLLMSKIVLPVAPNALAWKERRTARRLNAALVAYYPTDPEAP